VDPRSLGGQGFTLSDWKTKCHQVYPEKWRVYPKCTQNVPFDLSHFNALRGQRPFWRLSVKISKTTRQQTKALGVLIVISDAKGHQTETLKVAILRG
jgi:hypothetical protein